jgi:hypothetical protein
MRQTWQWKPNQTVHNYRIQRRYYWATPYRRQRFQLLPAFGAVIAIIMVVDLIAKIL